MSDVRFAELISKTAHELRSPLTSVQGFSGTLVKRWDRLRDEQRLELVGTIHADAVRMGRIISDVLDLARLETGRLHLDVANVNVAAIAEKATGNVARLEHIVTALVENAIKFSDSGPVEVRAEPHESTVVISVTDRGVGIEPVRIDEIFAGPAPAGQSATP